MWTDELKLTAHSYYLGVAGQVVILRWNTDENMRTRISAYLILLREFQGLL